MTLRSIGDPDRSEFNQKSVSSGELVPYGFANIDGSRSDIGRYTAVREGGKVADLSDYR